MRNTTPFNPRDAFGSTSFRPCVQPRVQVLALPQSVRRAVDGPTRTYKPTADDIPWARQPERKITIEDVEVRASSHYGALTRSNGKLGDQRMRRMFRRLASTAKPRLRSCDFVVSSAGQPCDSVDGRRLQPVQHVAVLPERIPRRSTWNTTVRVTSENFCWRTASSQPWTTRLRRYQRAKMTTAAVGVKWIYFSGLCEEVTVGDIP